MDSDLWASRIAAAKRAPLPHYLTSDHRRLIFWPDHRLKPFGVRCTGENPTSNPSEAPNDDFLEQILGMPPYTRADTGLSGSDGSLSATESPMVFQLSSGNGDRTGGGGYHHSLFSPGLNLDQGRGKNSNPIVAGDLFSGEDSNPILAIFPNFAHQWPHKALIPAIAGALDLGLAVSSPPLHSITIIKYTGDGLPRGREEAGPISGGRLNNTAVWVQSIHDPLKHRPLSKPLSSLFLAFWEDDDVLAIYW